MSDRGDVEMTGGGPPDGQLVKNVPTKLISHEYRGHVYVYRGVTRSGVRRFEYQGRREARRCQ
jgi:hypothetical protein